jgi:putative hydrolase of the HAD superfamily
LNIDNHRISQELADSFTTKREELAQPFPGSLEALRILRNKGIRMGLITNGDAQFQRPKIHRFGLDQFFDPILIESELGIGKPEKQIFLYALKQLGASPAQAWMVGDNLRLDIQPAQELGMNTVWVDYDKKGLPADSPVVPSSIIHSLMELL